ncbi:MAG TPA: DeoR/GlpR family DNA-binding transcription regulator [Gaiellaceae bacterium]|jgi:DeoR/GlpR family transcriptional regulator of sugar metabolism|nr:DeoR/GlpR family DNA-binding transcription regulator [Gaiellaceae bacterium]
MLAGQRQMLILEEVRRRGAVRVSELTELLRVSDMTIRRDLDVLAASGLVEKVHGGATVRGALSTDEPGFQAKSRRQLEEKEAIAKAASELVEPGQAIGLTAGTTTWRLAHLLVDAPDLTIVTNSIPVANVLERDPRSDRTVVLTGGVRTPSDALVGPIAVATLQSLHVDVLFIGVHGMADEAGFTTPNLLEAETNQAFISAAQRVVVVADHTKWGLRGLSRIARLADAHVLVTDDGLRPEARVALEEHVGSVIVAPVSARRSRAAGSRAR